MGWDQATPDPPSGMGTQPAPGHGDGAQSPPGQLAQAHAAWHTLRALLMKHSPPESPSCQAHSSTASSRNANVPRAFPVHCTQSPPCEPRTQTPPHATHVLWDPSLCINKTPPCATHTLGPLPMQCPHTRTPHHARYTCSSSCNTCNNRTPR